jgi:hypothetical protein
VSCGRWLSRRTGSRRDAGSAEKRLDRLEVEHSVASKSVTGPLVTGAGAEVIAFFRVLPPLR